MARLAPALAACLFTAACATAGDVGLLTSTPEGSVITPAEKSFPPLQRFPITVAADSWVGVKSATSALGNDREADAVIARVRGYFETDGAYPAARLVVTPGPPQVTSGAEAPFIGDNVSASKSVQSWAYTVTVEDWDNPARAALSLSRSIEVVGTLRISFDDIDVFSARTQGWMRETTKRGIQNVLVEMIEDLERNRSQLAALRARYVARRGTPPPSELDLAGRIDRINRIDTLLEEAERLNPAGAELGELRRRLDDMRRAIRAP